MPARPVQTYCLPVTLGVCLRARCYCFCYKPARGRDGRSMIVHRRPQPSRHEHRPLCPGAALLTKHPWPRCTLPSALHSPSKRPDYHCGRDDTLRHTASPIPALPWTRLFAAIRAGVAMYCCHFVSPTGLLPALSCPPPGAACEPTRRAPSTHRPPPIGCPPPRRPKQPVLPANNPSHASLYAPKGSIKALFHRTCNQKPWERGRPISSARDTAHLHRMLPALPVVAMRCLCTRVASRPRNALP